MKTKTGFEYEIKEENLDNWDLLKGLREIDKGNEQYIVDVLPLLLGKEQAERLEEHVRKDGKVKVTDILAEFEDIMSSKNEAKN